MITSEFMLMRCLHCGNSQDGAGHRKAEWLEGWNFPPHPQTSNRGGGLEVELYSTPAQ